MVHRNKNPNDMHMGNPIFLPFLDRPGIFSGKFVYKNADLVDHQITCYPP
jgi:hypothetical protein